MYGDLKKFAIRNQTDSYLANLSQEVYGHIERELGSIVV